MLSLLCCVGSSQALAHEPAKTSDDWAKAIEKSGLPNLHKVNDNLYRGAQPEKEGYAELAELGIKTIVCLRESDPDLKAIKGSKLECVHIPMKTWNPTHEEAVEFLKVVADKSKQPIYVHCKHGSDRTGTMCAIYRIAIDGWSKDDAIREMTKGDFGFHPCWSNLIRFIKKLDMEAIKKKADLKE
jgi:protein tyrosine/serine phosphatase